MSVDEFFSLVRILSNHLWVRYYLHSPPGRLVIEVAVYPKTEYAADTLHAELTEKGFARQETLRVAGWSLHSWWIARVD